MSRRTEVTHPLLDDDAVDFLSASAAEDDAAASPRRVLGMGLQLLQQCVLLQGAMVILTMLYCVILLYVYLLAKDETILA